MTALCSQRRDRLRHSRHTAVGVERQPHRRPPKIGLDRLRVEYRCNARLVGAGVDAQRPADRPRRPAPLRSEEHTSELQSLMRTSYAVFCLKKKKPTTQA